MSFDFVIHICSVGTLVSTTVLFTPFTAKLLRYVWSFFRSTISRQSLLVLRNFKSFSVYFPVASVLMPQGLGSVLIMSSLR